MLVVASYNLLRIYALEKKDQREGKELTSQVIARTKMMPGGSHEWLDLPSAACFMNRWSG